MLDCCQVSQSTYVGKPDYIVVGLSSLVHSWCNDRTAHSGPATGCGGGSKAGKTSDVCRLPNAWRNNNVSLVGYLMLDVTTMSLTASTRTVFCMLSDKER